MQREEDFISALRHAEASGGCQIINQIAIDLGVKILIRSAFYDTLSTIIGFEIREDDLGRTVSKAVLTDENGIAYTLLGIRKLSSGDPFPWFMEFEPLLAESKVLTLTIEQLQSVEGDAVPMIKLNTVMDPWDPMELDQALLDKLERWKEELQAPSTPLPPAWECMGQWQYRFAPDFSARERLCTGHSCFIEIPLVNQMVKISRVLSGLTGTLLFCDSYYTYLDSREDNWKETFLSSMESSRTPMEFAAKLKRTNLQVYRPMFFKFSLYSRHTQYSYPCSGTGPWGLFNTRFYYFSDSIEPAHALTLRIEEVFNLALETPWVFELDLKDVAVNKEIPFTLNSAFITIEGRFTITEILYDMEYILISHEMEIFTGNVNYIRLREMKLIDQDGNEYHPLDRSSHWSEQHGRFIKGICFPPVHYRGSDATLEITSIDIAPLVPFEFSLTLDS